MYVKVRCHHNNFCWAWVILLYMGTKYNKAAMRCWIKSSRTHLLKSFIVSIPISKMEIDRTIKAIRKIVNHHHSRGICWPLPKICIKFYAYLHNIIDVAIFKVSQKLLLQPPPFFSAEYFWFQNEHASYKKYSKIFSNSMHKFMFYSMTEREHMHMWTYGIQSDVFHKRVFWDLLLLPHANSSKIGSLKKELLQKYSLNRRIFLM